MTESRKSYGWVIVASAFCVALIAYGVQYSFGIFLKPVAADMGWSRTIVTGAVSLFEFARGSLAIFSGWMTDKYGPRKTITIGGIFLGLGLLLTSMIDAAWQLYVFYGLMVGFGLSIAFTPLVATTSRWFVAKRGLAIGIVVSGTGMGTIVMSPLATYLISAFEWRYAYIVIAVLVWLIIIPAALLMKRNPVQKGNSDGTGTQNKENDDIRSTIAENSPYRETGFSIRDAFRVRSFWILLVIIIFWSMGVQMIMIHIFPHATDLNISDAVAANILVIIGIFSIIGRLVMGGVADRLGGRGSLAICLVMQAIAMFWLLLAKDVWAFYLFAVVFGFSYAGSVPQLPIIVGELFQLRSIGTIVGCLFFGVAVGGAVGPLLAAYVYDASSSYYIAFLASGIAVIMALILLLFMRTPYRGTQPK